MKEIWIVVPVIVSCLSVSVDAQQAPEPPPCNPYVLQKVVSNNPLRLNRTQRWCIYAGSIFTGQAFFGSAFMAGVAQLRNDPVEWQQGTRGYLRRFGTRYAQGATKTTAEFVVGTLLREDPRYQVSVDTGFWKRTGHALSTVFLAQRLEENTNREEQKVKTQRYPNFSKLSGAASSGAIGLAWYPARLNTPGQVLARTGSAYGGYVASAMFNEFKANIFHLLSRALGSDRGSPSMPKEK